MHESTPLLFVSPRGQPPGLGEASCCHRRIEASGGDANRVERELEMDMALPHSTHSDDTDGELVDFSLWFDNGGWQDRINSCQDHSPCRITQCVRDSLSDRPSDLLMKQRGRLLSPARCMNEFCLPCLRTSFRKCRGEGSSAKGSQRCVPPRGKGAATNGDWMPGPRVQDKASEKALSAATQRPGGGPDFTPCSGSGEHSSPGDLKAPRLTASSMQLLSSLRGVDW